MSVNDESSIRPTDRGRRYVLKVGTAVVSTGISLAFAEVVARRVFDTRVLPLPDKGERSAPAEENVFDNHTPKQAIDKLHTILTKGQYPLNIFQFNSYIQFVEYTRGFVWEKEGKLSDRIHKIHNLGFRIPRSRNVVDFEPGGLMAGGCSWTYGSGVAPQNTFSNVAGSNLGLDAYNFGVASYSYVNALHQLEDLIQSGVIGELKPRHFVLGAGSWLFKRSTSPFYPTYRFQMLCPYVAGPDNAPRIVRPDADYTFQTVAELLKAYFPTDNRDVELTPERTRLLEGVYRKMLHVKRMKENFTRIIGPESLYAFILPQFLSLCKSQGMTFSVLWMPSRKKPIEHLNPMQRVCRNIGCRVIDGRRVWDECNVDPGSAYHPGGHPSEALHVGLGELLSKELKS